jgi:hypothetical protein
VLAALAQNRLVTLLGPGGVGKTRLAAMVAQAAATQYPLGASFVDLVPVREGYVAEAAAVLGLTEHAGQSLDAVLHEYFGRGKALLVLDNCEHLLPVVTMFAEKLLANCATLTVLATSRERLAIAGERIVGLRPLSVVADGGDGGSEAGRLFLDRACVIDPHWGPTFDVVADDLRAATAWAALPDGQELRHQLACDLGHLTYARRFLGESREHYQTAATLAGQPRQAASDLRTAADVAMAEGDGARAFDLLLASADKAAAAQDGRGRAVALAWAATIADRFAGNFPEEKPHKLLQRLVNEASSAAPADDPVAAAYLASAVAWTAHPGKSVPHPALAHDTLAAARQTGDPVLINAALDAVIVALDTSGQLCEAYQVSKERAALLTSMPRHEPRSGPEIADTLYMLTEISPTAALWSGTGCTPPTPTPRPRRWPARSTSCSASTTLASRSGSATTPTATPTPTS